MRIVYLTSMYLMALAYFGAGVNHFVNPDFYIGIMPRWMPWLPFWNAASGVAEVVLAVGLLVPATRRVSAWLIFAMLWVFMIVHVDMIVNYQNFGESALPFLIARIPLQFLLMAWAYWYTRPVPSVASK